MTNRWGSRVVSIDLIFGAHAIEEKEDTQIRQTSTEFIIHSGWDEGELVNDIALVKLPTPIEETDYVKVIKISTDTVTYAGEQGESLFWRIQLRDAVETRANTFQVS